MKLHRGDTLSYRDREFDVLEQPLEAYFDLIGERPSFLRCSDHSRGYAANWLVEDGWLYLTGLAGVWSDATPLGMRQLFPVGGRKVFAAWFTGQLRGARIGPNGPSSVAESRAPDLVLNITCGRVNASSMVHRPLLRPVVTLPREPRLPEPLPSEPRPAHA